MNRKALISVAVAAVSSGILVLQSPAADAPAQPTAEPTPATETRVYDVRDLTLQIADYPLSGALVSPTSIGQPGEGNTSLNQTNQLGMQANFASSSGGNQPPKSPTPIDNLIKAITDTVSTDTWKTNGGTVGAISSLNGELLVTQTADNLKKVDDILHQLRSGKPPTVRVRADWILLQPGKVEDLFKNGREDKSALPEINRDALDKMPVQAAHYTANVSCFSGQTVHLASGRARTFIDQASPVVAQSAVGYQVSPEIVQFGLALQVMPVVSGDSATLDLKGESSGGQNEPATQPSENGVDRLNAVVQHFHTTVQVPLNKPVLLEGATIEPSLDQPQGAELYLIVEADTGN